MRNVLVAALLAGCADDVEPSLETRLCTEFDGQLADAEPALCRIDTADHSVQISAPESDAYYRDPDGTSQFLFEATGPFVWTGDSEPGIALLVGETIGNAPSSPQDPDRTCAWRRCE